MFEQVGLLFENHHGIGRTIMYDSLFARKKLGSTGLGQGIAIPHVGRIKELPEALGAFVRTRSPIPFDSPDGRGVTQIFVLLVPEQALHRPAPANPLRARPDVQRQTVARANSPGAPDAQSVHQVFAQWQTA